MSHKKIIENVRYATLLIQKSLVFNLAFRDTAVNYVAEYFNHKDERMVNKNSYGTITSGKNKAYDS